MSDYHRHHDMLQAIIDSISTDPNTHKRLADIQQLYKDANRMFLQARDEAAYDIRTQFASEDAEYLAGVSRRHIDYWARRWQRRHGLPPLRQKKRIDLSTVTDLSGGGRFPAIP